MKTKMNSFVPLILMLAIMVIPQCNANIIEFD